MKKIVVSKDSIRTFYEQTISQNLINKENLFGDVEDEFIEITTSIPHNQRFQALDLGYGFGNYSVFLAKHGYQVTAVDFITPSYLIQRASEENLLSKLCVIQADIESYWPPDFYSVFIAKDVLHYLSKSTVVNILNEVVLKSNSIACHWFSIFTDIYRRGTDGQMIMVENEAQFNSNEFIALIGQVYSNWHISISTQYYEEGEYFQAYKVSVIAQKNT